MKSLSSLLNETVINKLRQLISNGEIPDVTFELAMKFILTDGILPEGDLPVASFTKLEDWLRLQSQKNEVVFTTTDLKNKTGEVVDEVLRGKTVRLQKHGRVIAEIKPV